VSCKPTANFPATRRSRCGASPDLETEASRQLDRVDQRTEIVLQHIVIRLQLLRGHLSPLLQSIVSNSIPEHRAFIRLSVLARRDIPIANVHEMNSRAHVAFCLRAAVASLALRSKENFRCAEQKSRRALSR